MKVQLKPMLSVIGEHLIYMFLSLILVSLLGSIFGSWTYGVSIITILIYVSSAYSAGWHQSGKDFRSGNEISKNDPDGKNPYRIYAGFVIALPMLAISLVLFILMRVFGIGLWFTLYRVYNMYFLFLFDVKRFGLVMEIVAVLLPYLAYSLGYIAGKSKKVFVSKYFNKLIYKKK